MVQHGITGKLRDHLGMRAAVCDAMVSMSEAEEWSENHFGGSWWSYLQFVTANSLPGTWTDEAGIMVQATAIFLGRIIRVVGTINAGHGDGWTTIEAGAEAELLPPLHIGYYQDWHYQSLALVPGTASSLHSQDGNNNREVPALPSVAAQSSPPPRPTPVRRAVAPPSPPPIQRVQPRRGKRQKTFSAVVLTALTAMSLHRQTPSRPPPSLAPAPSQSGGSPPSVEFTTPPRVPLAPDWPATPPNFLWSGSPYHSPVPTSPSPKLPFKNLLHAAGIVVPAPPLKYNLDQRNFIMFRYHDTKGNPGWYEMFCQDFLHKFPARRIPPTRKTVHNIYKKQCKKKTLEDLPRSGRPSLLTAEKLEELDRERQVDLHKSIR